MDSLTARKLGALLAASLLCLSAWLSPASGAERTKAINFQFTDVAGKTIRLSDFKGQWVLVNFWAPWCPLCWPEIPTLNELNKRKDFVVIGVGMDYGPDEDAVRGAIQQHNMQFQAYVFGGSRRDPNSAFRQVGPVDFYPTSYLYAPNGEIVMFMPGQIRRDKVLAFMASYKASAYAEASEHVDATEKRTDASEVGAVKPASYEPKVPISQPEKVRSKSKKMTTRY
jgi:thiol-disulfide isomerase/thioredoxin